MKNNHVTSWESCFITMRQAVMLVAHLASNHRVKLSGRDRLTARSLLERGWLRIESDTKSALTARGQRAALRCAEVLQRLPDDDAFHNADDFLSGRVAAPETGGVKRTPSGLADTVPDYGDVARSLSQIAQPVRISGARIAGMGCTAAPNATPHAGANSDDARGAA